MNESAGAHDALPPNLTDSESESGSESEAESDQENVVGESGLKHQLDSDLNTTYNANASEKESDKANQTVIKKCHMLNCDLTFVDEWSHCWECHPDSSNRFWGWHPDLFESVEVKKSS